MKDKIVKAYKSLQDSICRALEIADGKGKFKEDYWERPGGGGGRSRVMEGQKIEKGGVNFSEVHGEMPEKMALKMGLQPNEQFLATGVSIVLHPHSPMAPIIHMNVRYFEAESGKYWFGGGIDLTPHYIDREDARFFHQTLKSVCDQHDVSFYPTFKKHADDYFFIKHRQETRGIGGIFYDYLSEQNTALDKAQLLQFSLDVGNSFAPIYTELLNRSADRTFGEVQKQWQYLRRGRYVEFNLVWDRGTKFGLETDGRTESILMSLPPTANWVYQHQPEPDSPEQKTLDLLKKGIDWEV